MNIVAIIQARMGSTRLPGKVLMDLSGKTVLERVIRRTKRAKRISEVVVATTTNPQDRGIARLCYDLDVPFTCGSEYDVLDRYYKTARQYNADIIVRITSDCPLVDPSIIDGIVLQALTQKNTVYVSNTLYPRTFPRGLDVEAIRFKALRQAQEEDTDPLSREHVTPYIRHHPDLFLALGYYLKGSDLSGMRWTVDTPDDLRLLRLIFSSFDDDEFTWLEVVDLLERKNPEWSRINSHIAQKETR